MVKSDSIKALAMALSKAQAEMGAASKAKDNSFFSSKYADLSEVVKVVKPAFGDHGLSYVQFPIEQDGRIGVETILMHESGEFISSSFTVALKKQDAQAAGSAITYCRRYALQAMAGIPSDDDDGNGAGISADDDGKTLQGKAFDESVRKGAAYITDNAAKGDLNQVLKAWRHAINQGTSAVIYQKLDQATKSKIDSLGV